MALKYLLNSTAYTALSDELKALYIAGDTDGEFVLDITGLPAPEDTGPLKRGLEAEKGKYKELKAKYDEAKAKIDGFPDVDALKKDHETATGKLTGFVNKTLKDSVALSIATKISNAPSLLAPKIAERIGVDMSGDEPKTVFLGADGKPNAELTVEKLSEEFVANPDYKAIIVASRATGGGAPKKPLIAPMGGGAPHGEPGDKPFDAARAKPSELVAHLQAKKGAEADAQQ